MGSSGAGAVVAPIASAVSVAGLLVAALSFEQDSPSAASDRLAKIAAVRAWRDVVMPRPYQQLGMIPITAERQVRLRAECGVDCLSESLGRDLATVAPQHLAVLTNQHHERIPGQTKRVSCSLVFVVDEHWPQLGPLLVC